MIITTAILSMPFLLLFYGILSIAVVIILARLLTMDKFDFTVNVFITVANHQFIKFQSLSSFH